MTSKLPRKVLLGELAKRAAGKQNVQDQQHAYLSELFDRQVDFINDPARRVTLRCRSSFW
jgi:hypothetical protein